MIKRLRASSFRLPSARIAPYASVVRSSFGHRGSPPFLTAQRTSKLFTEPRPSTAEIDNRVKILPFSNRSEPVPGAKKSAAQGVNWIFNHPLPTCVQATQSSFNRRLASRIARLSHEIEQSESMMPALSNMTRCPLALHARIPDLLKDAALTRLEKRPRRKVIYNDALSGSHMKGNS